MRRRDSSSVLLFGQDLIFQFQILAVAGGHLGGGSEGGNSFKDASRQPVCPLLCLDVTPFRSSELLLPLSGEEAAGGPGGRGWHATSRSCRRSSGQGELPQPSVGPRLPGHPRPPPRHILRGRSKLPAPTALPFRREEESEPPEDGLCAPPGWVDFTREPESSGGKS